MFCPPVREIIYSLKLLDYLHVQADKPFSAIGYVIVIPWLVRMYAEIIILNEIAESGQSLLYLKKHEFCIPYVSLSELA